MQVLTEVPRMPPLDCADCSGKLWLREKPPSWSGGGLFFYGCENYPQCMGLCFAHPDGTPQGTPAPKSVRVARRAAHKALDPLWRGGTEGQRSLAYRWLAVAMGVPGEDCHIGVFDAGQCSTLVLLCTGVTQKSLIKWGKENPAP